MKMPESMKQASIWVVWAFIAIGVLGWALFVVLDHFEVKEQASWVQAVGSVMAIGVAIWISELGHRRDRARADRAEVSEEVRVAWLAECATNEASAAILGIKDQVEAAQGLLVKVDTTRLAQAGELLRSVLQQRLPHRAVNVTFLAVADVAEVEDLVSRWNIGTLPPDWARILEERATAVRACGATVRMEYQRLAESYGILYTQRVFP